MDDSSNIFGSEESKDTMKSSSRSFGVSSRSSQQPIFKQKLQKYETLAPELKALVDHDFKQEIGFSKIIEILIESKKPMAGHHMIFDLAYLLNQFVEELPPTYIEFAKRIHEMFPMIYDSRTLSISINNSSNQTQDKTELKFLFDKVRKDKKYANNLSIVFDAEKDQRFSYLNEKGLIEG